jgi:hypothetical protein
MKYRRGVRNDQTLFGDLLATEERRQKGRDGALLEKRDVRLYHRYYYYRSLLKKSYEEALLELQEDFEISIETIPRIIDKYTTEVRRLMNEGITTVALREKYPKMVWDDCVNCTKKGL